MILTQGRHGQVAPFWQGLGGHCYVPKGSGSHPPPQLEGVSGCCFTKIGKGSPGPKLQSKLGPWLPGGSLSHHPGPREGLEPSLGTSQRLVCRKAELCVRATVKSPS